MIKAARLYRQIMPEMAKQLEGLTEKYGEYVSRARALKFEALVAYASQLKLKDSAKRLVRGEMSGMLAGHFPEAYVHPTLLKMARNILD